MSDRLSETIFTKLQKAIIVGDMPAGSRFPAERDLAEEFGVSRSTVREAVGRLAKSGLVETRPQSGTYVSDYQAKASLDVLIDIMQNGGEVDSDTLRALMETRLLIELHAVKMAVAAFTPDDECELRDIIGIEERSLSDPAAMAECDYRLHARTGVSSMRPAGKTRIRRSVSCARRWSTGRRASWTPWASASRNGRFDWFQIYNCRVRTLPVPHRTTQHHSSGGRHVRSIDSTRIQDQGTEKPLSAHPVVARLLFRGRTAGVEQ